MKKNPSRVTLGLLRLHVFARRDAALMYGVGSLGNVSGGYDRFEDYMRGDYVADMREDWMLVGHCLRESMRSVKK